MKISPLGEWVLVERVEEKRERTPGGVFIPETARDSTLKSQRGRVVAVGPGKVDEQTCQYLPVHVSVGQEILFGRFQGAEVEVDGKPYTILRETDIYAVIER